MKVWTRILAAASAIALAGCSMVPTSSEVHLGPVVDSGESSQFIRVIAAPPSPGASPTEIARGFLEANASQQDDWGIARQYLTSEAATSWDPQAATRIYDGASLKVTEKGREVSVELVQVASLRANGTLGVLAEPRNRHLRLRVSQVGRSGDQIQWRITNPQRGILIRQADLRRGFRLQRAYFMSNRAQILVPDGRMVPVVGASLPTRMAELVLAGPAAGLAPAVHSGAPPGLSLALGAVPVNSGVAVVDLGRQVLAASASQRRELAAQLTWTLTELPEVTAVRLTVESEPLEVSGAPILMDRGTWAEWGPDRAITGDSGSQLAPHYEVVGRQVVRVAADGSRSATPLPAPAGVSALAVALDESRVALVSGSGRHLDLLPQTPTGRGRSLPGSHFTGISYDINGDLWYVESGDLWRVGTDGSPQRVPLPDDLPGPPSRIRLARDGARAALLVDDKVYVAAISTVTADSGSAPGKLRLLAAEPVAIGLSRVSDVSWQDAGTLAVLGAGVAGSLAVQRLEVGEGHPVSLGAPSEPRTVAAAPLVPTLVLTEDEAIFSGVGLQWRESGGARAMQYPG